MTAEQDDVQAPGEPPRVCEHGIRWPWACEDCDNAWDAAHPQAEARPSEGEVGEAVERLSQLAKLSPNAFERAMERLSADGLRRDIRDILAELRWVGTANERLARLGRAVERERDEAFAAKEAAESKLSVLVEEMKNRGSVVPLASPSVSSPSLANELATPSSQATEKAPPNPEYEALADAAHAEIRAEVGEPNPFDTLTMLETWKADAEPAGPGGTISFSRALLDSATDALRIALNMARTEHLNGKTAQLRGLQDMREMLARFVEQGGDPTTAASLRANWNPEWGDDPGRPNPCGILQGGYVGPILSAKIAALKAAKFPPPDAREILRPKASQTSPASDGEVRDGEAAERPNTNGDPS